MGITLYVCCCLAGNYPDLPVFRFRDGDLVKFTRMFLPDALSCIVFVLTLTGICWVLSHILPEAVMKPVEYVSKNINKFYCVSYCVIIPCCRLVGQPSSNAVILALWIALTLLTAGIIMLYQRYFERSFVDFFSRHALFWTLAVWAVSLVIAFIVFNAYDEYPNFMNDYLET